MLDSKVTILLIRNDVVDPAEFLGGASIFSNETLKGLSAEKVSHHGH